MTPSGSRRKLQSKRGRLPSWWGNRSHKLFTLIVFVILSSLDNTATAIFPPLYGVISRDLLVSEAALGLITALRIMTTALSAAWWGYLGDRSDRKRLLIYGTLTWSLAIFISGLSQNYSQLLIFQLISAVGLGAVGSVGFSLVGDFIPPRRRGLLLSLWGMAQSIGWGIGAVLSSTFGAYAWPAPFWLIASSGVVFLFLYAFTYEPERGQTEPELAALFAAGKTYAYQVRFTDIRYLLTKRSNKWLILEGFIATLGLGAMIWLPRLFTAKVQAEGFGLETATVFGSTLSLVFQSGSYFAIPAGFLGDLWQRRSLRGRALLSTIGITAAVPFHIAFFLMPLGKLIIPEEKGMIQIALATLSAVFGNGTIALAFMVAVLASVLLAIDGPNRAALITDVNLPEHRGTVVGLAFLASGFGAALGNLLSGLFFTWLARFFDSPWHYAIGMSLFTFFLLPAGWCYYQVSKSSSEDILTVQQALAERASFLPEPPSADSPSTLAVDPQTKPLP